jgi:acetyl esterase/lipase
MSFGDARVAGQPFTLGGLAAGWPKEAPMRTLVYHEGLKLDFYPAIGRENAPCVIVIHGGGWDSGERGQIATFNSWLARGGYAAADISYRLAPGAVWPAQRDDVAASIAYVKGHAAELGVDPTRIVLFGRSAGGQIAEACAYGLKDPSIRGVIAFYAPADMNFAWKWGREDDALNSPRLLRRFLGGDPGTAGPAYDSASGIGLVNSGSPPTLLVHGVIDTLVWVRQSERLSARLSEAGVPNLLVSLPWATHALELNPDSPSGQLASYSTSWFLASVCR